MTPSYVFVAAVCVAVATVGVWVGFQLLWWEFLLDRHSVTATATVVEVRAGVRSPGTLLDRLPAPESTVTALVSQGWTDDYRVGDPIRIEYSPDDPTVARVAGSHDLLKIVPVIVGWAAFFAFLRWADGPRRARRRVARRV